jgi:hypothetical protein
LRLLTEALDPTRQANAALPVAKKAQERKFPVHFLLPACVHIKTRVSNWMSHLEGGNVAECAIAKSGSRYGGARERHSCIAYEPAIEPRGRASNGKGDTASREVISRRLN